MTARVSRRVNQAWHRFMTDRVVTFLRDPVVQRTDRFFLLGNSFGEEIRIALTRLLGAGQVGPDLAHLAYDPAVARIDALPARNHLNTYNPFSALQEIERILEVWTPAPDDYWETEDGLQCPYRSLVFAAAPEILDEVSADLDAALRDAFDAADHFIFTFGTTEVFINRVSGKATNQSPVYPQGGGREETDHFATTFAENYDAITRLVDLITAEKPEAIIFLCVSPVALKRTLSGEDIVLANTLAKATLRAVMAEVALTRPNVRYVPYYEAVLAAGDEAFMPDGRHVRRALVEKITRVFVQSACFPLENEADPEDEDDDDQL
jgi:hypothetical protein